MHDSLKKCSHVQSWEMNQIASYIGCVLQFRAKGKRLSEIDSTRTAVITT